mgnify:FL=1
MKCDLEVEIELSYLGCKVIRFWGKDILKDTDECIRIIEELIFDIMIENSYV